MGIGMTKIAGKGCVLARAVNHLLVGPGVTRDADDLMLAFKIDIQRLMRVVTTIDETTIQGFEADFNWLMSDNFSMFGGVGFLDSEIKKNINRPLSEGNDVPQAPE